MFGMVRVAVDDASNPKVPGLLPPPPIHVKTIGVGVEFNPGAGLGAGLQNGSMIDAVSIPLQ